MTLRFRLSILAIALIAVATASALWIRISLGTCETLDRWLGGSSCIAKYTISDIVPLPFATMVEVQNSRLRIFGYGGGKIPLPTQIVFDMAEGVETDRTPLPFPRSTLRAIPSLTGDRVAVICMMNDVCDRMRPQGYILSSGNGEILTELPVANAGEWTFPDENRIVIGLDAATLNNRNLVVYPDDRTGGLILKKRSGAIETERLSPPDAKQAFGGPTVLAARASPSGRYVAVINSATDDHEIGTRLDVWDMDGRKIIKQITTDSKHRLDTNAIWSKDEQHLIALHAFSDGDTKYGADLYVLKLRD